uniref:Uncharacterized protein n=1 Tax=Panagrolaimus sp. JU765 TaxID=591449 RepID=A0AC34QY24_9BILA
MVSELKGESIGVKDVDPCPTDPICGLDLKAQETALKLGLDIVIATPGRLIDHVNNSSFSLSSIEILETALKLGLDIVIATPGRLIDHVNNSSFSLSSIEILVLDEADRMLDDTFADQMKEIIRLCSKSRQTMLFSATMTDEIEELAKLSLEKPVRLFINENTETAANLRQEFVRIRDENTREAIVCALVTRNFPDHTMVFMKSKKDCARMHVLLGLLGVKCAQLHGSLSQTVRVQSLQKFKTQEIDVLVCTELAARGLDIEGVLTVINMHMPNNVQQYIHRVGRTARAGKAGRAISLVGEDDRKLLKSIVKHNKNSTIKQRNIAPEVIVAYKERIDSLEESIEKVQNDAIVDNQLRLAEEKLSKAEKRLKTGVDERAGRVFLKTSTEIQKEAAAKAKKAAQKNRKQKEKDEMTPEEKTAAAEAAFQAREAKRAKKPKRLRAVVEDDDKDEKPSKKKRKDSDFAKKLTNISQPAVKKFRYGPNDQEFREAKRDRALELRLKNKNKRRK